MSKKQVVVPKDRAAQAALDTDTADPKDLVEVSLDEDQFRALMSGGVFAAINRVAASNIDDFEDETISDPDALQAALAELRAIRARSEGEVAGGVEVLIRLFMEAQRHRTEVDFFF